MDVRYTVRLATDADSEVWETFVSTFAPCHHAYRWAWRQILTKCFGHAPHYFLCTEGNEVRGVLPLFQVRSVFFGKSLVSVPYLNAGGVVACNAEAHAALLRAAETLWWNWDARYLEYRTRAANTSYANPAGEPLAVRTHKVAMVRELSPDPEQLFASFPAKLRSQIRRPTKAGLYAEVSEPTPAAVSAFYGVFAANMRDLGTPVYPQKLFELAAEHFRSRARIILVFKDRTAVAAGFTIGERDTVEIPWASSLRQHSKESPNMLLYWEAIKQGCRDGFSKFDFGRSSRDSGTYRFKEQWGAVPQELFWYYTASLGNVPDVNPHNPKFEMFVKCWQHLPLFVANTFGPYLTRSLP